MTRMVKNSVLFLGWAVVLSAHDLSFHMSIGARTFDVWKEFDNQFYQDISTANPQFLGGAMLLKFYYIGLTFPDMFWVQSPLRTIIDTLYNHRKDLLDPLKIEDWTKENVQVPIEFEYGDNSHNLQKLWEMAKYAKAKGWSSYEKSLIYGALMHVIHDRYGHMFMQPALFGYGLVYDSDSALSQILLAFGERYHELFSPTFITNWSQFVKPLYATRFLGSITVRQDVCTFYRVFDEAGRLDTTWQQQDFLPVKRYVDAAKAVGWNVKNLTQERLESYLTGWGILMFLLYGYKPDGTEIGGLYAHPLWSFDQYFEFVGEIGSDFIKPPWYIKLLEPIIQKYLKRTAFQIVRRLFPEVYGEKPWPTYFETRESLKDLFESMPPDLKEALWSEYCRMDRNLEFWEKSAKPDKHPRPPQKQSSYIDEPTIAVELNKFYKKSLAEGPGYIDEKMTYHGKRLEVWTIARKAGLLAGLYSIPEPVFPRPPGIVYQYFARKVDNEWKLVYTPLETEGYLPIRLYYDMFVKGRMRLQIRGKTKDGDDVLLAEQTFDLDEFERKTGYIEANVYQQDVIEIYWRLTTWYQEYTILQSDYRKAYFHSSLVYENKLYQELFKNGDPFRDLNQNPLYWEGPYRYWPYMVKIYLLLRPADLDVKRISTNQVRLTWTDRSGKETGFRIARRVEGEDWDTTYATVPANTEEFIDTVTVAHRYTYKV
ncbi:hypothetical protein DRP53_03565, partial [candidate division WOR-3 bacterium]